MSAVQYDIKLSIGYQYGAFAGHARNIVRLLPVDQPGRQTVRARMLGIDPTPDEWIEGVDFFGNPTAALAFHAPIDHIELTLRATVERFVPPPSLDFSPSLRGLRAELAALTALDGAAPHHFLGPSPRITYDPEIAAFGQPHATADKTTRQIVEAIGLALNSEMRFDAEATDVLTTATEAFANRHGVCQDFTHVMITALRALGIPAGYVSGFLRTDPPPGQPRLEGADAMHAWVCAWCGTEAGWLEYDPTNACFAGTDHIYLGRGRDYSDVSPVKGSIRTSAPQQSHQRVDVVPMEG